MISAQAGPASAGNTMALAVRDLRMRYGTKDVLSGVTFNAQRGEVLGLLGPNGAGKTTTIEILEGFRMPSAGEVSVLGVDPARGDEAWRSRIGVVLQSWRDHGQWRVRELLDYLARFRPRPARERRGRHRARGTPREPRGHPHGSRSARGGGGGRRASRGSPTRSSGRAQGMPRRRRHDHERFRGSQGSRPGRFVPRLDRARHMLTDTASVIWYHAGAEHMNITRARCAPLAIYSRTSFGLSATRRFRRSRVLDCGEPPWRRDHPVPAAP